MSPRDHPDGRSQTPRTTIQRLLGVGGFLACLYLGVFGAVLGISALVARPGLRLGVVQMLAGTVIPWLLAAGSLFGIRRVTGSIRLGYYAAVAAALAWLALIAFASRA